VCDLILREKGKRKGRTELVIHGNVNSIELESAGEDLLLLLGKELGSLGRVDNGKIGPDGGDDGQDTLND
jgi:hypothetical protein